MGANLRPSPPIPSPREPWSCEKILPGEGTGPPTASQVLVNHLEAACPHAAFSTTVSLNFFTDPFGERGEYNSQSCPPTSARINKWKVNQRSENRTKGIQARLYSNLRSTRSWCVRTLANLLISFIEVRAVMENKVPESSMVTGRVSTHAIAIARIVFS